MNSPGLDFQQHNAVGRHRNRQACVKDAEVASAPQISNLKRGRQANLLKIRMERRWMGVGIEYGDGHSAV